MFFSTAQKDVQITPLHAKIPMKIVKLGVVGFLSSFIYDLIFTDDFVCFV